MLLIIYLWILVVSTAIVHACLLSLAHTENGDVLGHTVTDNGYKYKAYLGIPYAAEMSGMRRFQAPVPPKPWKKVLNANRMVKCPSISGGEENCLIINVFTPLDFEDMGQMPVLFVIHGGAFLYTSSQTDGFGHLIKRKIVVVTLNYRLGALGFLCLRKKEAPGNAGLKDLVAGLKWVQTNIAGFGGNPKKVTLYGYSSGAVLVEALVLSDMTRGLFRGAIIESGSVFNYWATDVNPTLTALNVARQLSDTYFYKKGKVNISDLIDFYESCHIQVLKGTYQYYKNKANEMGGMAFAPCVESWDDNLEPMFTEEPKYKLIKRNYKSVPIMFVFSTLEALNFRGRYVESEEFIKRLSIRFEDYLPPDLIFESSTVKKNLANKIKRFYISGNALEGYLNFLSDIQITYGILESVKYHSKNTRVYLMEFAYKGSVGYHSNFSEMFKKTAHGDLSKHVFCRSNPQGDDKKAVQDSVKLVANFIKYSNPTARLERTLIWSPVTPGQTMSYLHFSRKMNISSNPYKKRMKLWYHVYKKYGSKQLRALTKLYDAFEK